LTIFLRIISGIITANVSVRSSPDYEQQVKINGESVHQSNAMKIISVMMVKNESDIIESCIRHNSLFIDHFLGSLVICGVVKIKSK
jgi:hypothetical protein